MKFRIYCDWDVFGYYDVKADTLEEAKEKVLAGDKPYDDLPPEGIYIDDSFRINDKATDEENLPMLIFDYGDMKVYLIDDVSQLKNRKYRTVQVQSDVSRESIDDLNHHVDKLVPIIQLAVKELLSKC